MSLQIDVPGVDNTRPSLSVPSRDMESDIGDKAMAAEMAKMEGSYILDNIGLMTGNTADVFSRDKEREQFEMQTGSETRAALTNSAQLNAWIDGNRPVEPSDYLQIIFPSVDHTHNYIQTVLNSQSNLAKQLLRLPAQTRNSLKFARRLQ